MQTWLRRERSLRPGRIPDGENKPRLVTLYGAGERESWERIAGRSFAPDGFFASDGTIFALALLLSTRGLETLHRRRKRKWRSEFRARIGAANQ